MAIQVASTVHAAVTIFALNEGEEKVFFQSPQGCVVQRAKPFSDDEESGWIVLLDYPLDVGSTAFTAAPFMALDPVTPYAKPAVPVLFHIDDSVKALAFVTCNEDGWTLVTQSFHALFLNFQANQSEFYPIVEVPFPISRDR